MLADYIANRIDTLFSDKLSKTSSQLTKTNSGHQSRPYFNRQTIKTHLPSVVSKHYDPSRSPACRRDKSASPISKSRFKFIIGNNRGENIKSVVTGTSQFKIDLSPCKTLDIDTGSSFKAKLHSQLSRKQLLFSNKQNDIIRYYRQERKSMEKSYNNGQRSQGKSRKSRIFRPQLSHQVSKGELRY